MILGNGSTNREKEKGNQTQDGNWRYNENGVGIFMDGFGRNFGTWNTPGRIPWIYGKEDIMDLCQVRYGILAVFVCYLKALARSIIRRSFRDGRLGGSSCVVFKGDQVGDFTRRLYRRWAEL